MNVQSRDIGTRPGFSYEFGVRPQVAPFVYGSQVSDVVSVMWPFDAVKPYLSDKPLRRPARTRTIARRCDVYLIPEIEGGFSVVAANLPGVASQGETEEEALANIKEAFEGSIQSYKEHALKIPWLATPEGPEPGSILRTVVIHV